MTEPLQLVNTVSLAAFFPQAGVKATLEPPPAEKAASRLNAQGTGQHGFPQVVPSGSAARSSAGGPSSTGAAESTRGRV